MSKKSRIIAGILLLCCILMTGLTTNQVFGSGDTEGNSVSGGSSQKVFDQADLFLEEEAAVLEDEAFRLAEEWQYDVAIATTDNTGSMVTYEYAEQFYNTHGIGYGEYMRGVLLLIDMDNREIYIDEYNAAEEGFEISTSERDKILDVIMEYAYDGDFYGCANAFLEQLPEYVHNGESGDADYWDAVINGEPGSETQLSTGELLIKLIQYYAPMAALAALVIATIVLIVLIVQQKTGSKSSAGEYQKGPMELYRKQDHFINTTVVKHKIETESRSAGGGGGSSHHGGGHSGGGRSF